MTECAGCGLPIREVEEFVWVNGGTDQCEAGGVHSPPRTPDAGDLMEVWLIRNSERWAEIRYWSESGWTPDIRFASLYTEPPAVVVNAAWAGSELVRFVESPF